MQKIQGELGRRAQEQYQKGMAAMRGKSHAEAVAHFNEALKLNPQNEQARGKLQEAKRLMAKRVDPALKKEAARLYYRAVDEYLKREYGKCRGTINRIFELDPFNEGAVKLKAKLEATLE